MFVMVSIHCHTYSCTGVGRSVVSSWVLDIGGMGWGGGLDKTYHRHNRCLDKSREGNQFKVEGKVELWFGKERLAT